MPCPKPQAERVLSPKGCSLGLNPCWPIGRGPGFWKVPLSRSPRLNYSPSFSDRHCATSRNRLFGFRRTVPWTGPTFSAGRRSGRSDQRNKKPVVWVSSSLRRPPRQIYSAALLLHSTRLGAVGNEGGSWTQNRLNCRQRTPQRGVIGLLCRLQAIPCGDDGIEFLTAAAHRKPAR